METATTTFKMTTNSKYFPKKIGIYAIINTHDGKKYIGMTKAEKGFYRRWLEHRRDLRNGDHQNKHLQRAFNKFGEECFSFQVLRFCDDVENIEKIEGEYIIKENTLNDDYGYNFVAYDEELDKIDYSKRRVKEIKYEFITPDGNIVSGVNLSKFAKENGLSDSHLHNVMNGKLYSHKGYKSTNTDFHRKKVIYEIVSPSGVLYTFSEDERLDFCEKHNIGWRNLATVFNGTYSHSKGWHVKNILDNDRKIVEAFLHQHKIHLKNKNYVFKSVTKFANTHNIPIYAVSKILKGCKCHRIKRKYSIGFGHVDGYDTIFEKY